MKTFWPDCPKCGVNDQWIATEEDSGYSTFYLPDGPGWSLSDEVRANRNLEFYCGGCNTDLMDMELDSENYPIPPAELELTRKQLNDRSFKRLAHSAQAKG